MSKSHRTIAALALAIVALATLPILVAAGPLPAAPAAGQRIPPATLTVLSSFADSYIAEDLHAAAALFGRDGTIYHAFDDGLVSRISGPASIDYWLSFRVFTLPQRWALIPAAGPTSPTPPARSAPSSAPLFVIFQLSQRDDGMGNDSFWAEAPLLLDADLDPDGAIGSLYVAYSEDGLARARAAADGTPAPVQVGTLLSAAGITAPVISPAPRAQQPTRTPAPVVFVAPTLGDLTLPVAGLAVGIAALLTRRTSQRRPGRGSTSA